MPFITVKNQLPQWLKYAIVVYLISVPPYWFMFRSGDSEPAWLHLLKLAPALAALLSGRYNKDGRLGHISWRSGTIRFWFLAVSLPLLIETITVATTIFLRPGDWQTIAEVVRRRYEMAGWLPWKAPSPLLTEGAIAASSCYAFALTEELGWRGTLHLHCAARFGFLKGAAVVGLIWGVWQIPAIISENSNLAGLPGTIASTLMAAIALSIVLAHFYEQSGSIWVAALLHATLDSVHGVHRALSVETGNGFPINVLWTGLWVIVAEICLWMWTRSNQISKRYQP